MKGPSYLWKQQLVEFGLGKRRLGMQENQMDQLHVCGMRSLLERERQLSHAQEEGHLLGRPRLLLEHTLREVKGGQGRSREVIRGHQRSSEVIRAGRGSCSSTYALEHIGARASVKPSLAVTEVINQRSRWSS